MPEVNISPAPGALCGEHYIEIRGRRVGTIQWHRGIWTVNLYPIYIHLGDLSLICRACEEFSNVS